MFYRIKNGVLFDYADYQYSDECQYTDIITKTELDKDKNKVVVEEYDIIIPQEEGEEIKETRYRLILNPDYPEIALTNAKEKKYEEANSKAKLFLNNEALYELNPNFHVEATKENMNTFSSAATGIEKGFMKHQEWTSKEDNVLNLTAEQCMQIAFGIGAIQGDVWCRQFIDYKNAINEAQTVEEVESIVISYERGNDEI